MITILKNISSLVTCRSKVKKRGISLRDAGLLENGYVVIEADKIIAVGTGEGYKAFSDSGAEIIDCTGKTVTPGLIDCHTHVVYAGSRENELKLKLNGSRYIDILNSGGGILSTVKKTREASFEDLICQSKKRMDTMLKHGTTTIESKSGYGLTLDDEVKILKVNKALDDLHPISIISTYMGAHAIPFEYRDNREKYIEEIITKHIPYIANNSLAKYIDCFCEKGVFTVEESRRILLEGKKFGLGIKVHADEIESVGGAELAGELSAISAEHLVAISDDGIRALAEKEVIAVLLPSTSFYLMLNHYADVRKMIDNGVAIALATDCNPGTSPNESLALVMTLACYGMKLLPEEIINAVTINAAYAIGMEKEIGSIEVGKKADLVIFDAISLDYLMYHIGSNAVNFVFKNGKIVIMEGNNV